MVCGDEQQLAIDTGSSFVPRCKQGDTDRYESCQCDVGHDHVQGKCWCSDQMGNMYDDSVMQIGKDGQFPKFFDSWDAVCDKMNCDKTTISPSKAPVFSPTLAPTQSANFTWDPSTSPTLEPIPRPEPSDSAKSIATFNANAVNADYDQINPVSMVPTSSNIWRILCVSLIGVLLIYAIYRSVCCFRGEKYYKFVDDVTDHDEVESEDLLKN